ncbi:MAG TPA: hypothetical protein VG893_14265 [Terracidiphilus sp.]|nr:hypothetical protein [Terracidiphilus sp.]
MAFAVMQWLILAMIVSLVGLLVAGAGMVWHIWLHRHRLNSKEPADVAVPSGETDLESEP